MGGQRNQTLRETSASKGQNKGAQFTVWHVKDETGDSDIAARLRSISSRPAAGIFQIERGHDSGASRTIFFSPNKQSSSFPRTYATDHLQQWGNQFSA